MLLSQGNRHGGYALYVNDGRLHFVHNYLSLERFTVSAEPLVPTGEVILRMEFLPTGPPRFLEGFGVPAEVRLFYGEELVGYGELVIIKHNDSLLSAYGHNRKRLVKEGQRVSAGQQIAEMGSTGASRNELQFQIRKDGNPVDPLGYLPAR